MSSLALVVLPAVVLGPWLVNEAPQLVSTDARQLLHESLNSGGLSTLDARYDYERPLVADPQAAFFYLPTWLFAFIDPVRAASVFVVAHSVLALWGMYRLLRSQRFTRSSSWFGALVFGFSGFMLAHLNDLPTLSAAAWLPIVFWRFSRYTDLGGTRCLAYAAFSVALMGLTGQMQLVTLAAVGTLVFLLPRRENLPQAIARWGLTWFCALGLFAVQILPVLAWLKSGYARPPSYSEFFVSSWNPLLLIGWLLPNIPGNSQLLSSAPYSYIGILPLLLASIAVCAGRRLSTSTRGWTVVLISSLLLSLGRYGPIHPILYWLPGAAIFKNPASALLLFELAIAVLAAGIVHHLQGNISPAWARLRAAVIGWTKRPILLATYLYGIPLLAALVLSYLNSSPDTRPKLSAVHICLPAVTIGISVAVLWFVIRRWWQPRLIGLLALVALLDLTAAAWFTKIPAAPELINNTATRRNKQPATSDRGPAFIDNATFPAATRIVEHAPHAVTTYVDTWPETSNELDSVQIVLARKALPGWQASSEGLRMRLSRTKDDFLAVRIPVGIALEINWRYTPPGLLPGALVSILSATVLAACVLFTRVSESR